VILVINCLEMISSAPDHVSDHYSQYPRKEFYNEFSFSRTGPDPIKGLDSSFRSACRAAEDFDNYYFITPRPTDKRIVPFDTCEDVVFAPPSRLWPWAESRGKGVHDPNLPNDQAHIAGNFSRETNPTHVITGQASFPNPMWHAGAVSPVLKASEDQQYQCQHARFSDVPNAHRCFNLCQGKDPKVLMQCASKTQWGMF
jgi:hypothetical protein